MWQLVKANSAAGLHQLKHKCYTKEMPGETTFYFKDKKAQGTCNHWSALSVLVFAFLGSPQLQYPSAISFSTEWPEELGWQGTASWGIPQECTNERGGGR